MAIWQPPLAAVYPQAASLDWALAHVESFGDTIFLPQAFEYQAIRYDCRRSGLGFDSKT
jgi:hypothetical protein